MNLVTGATGIIGSHVVLHLLQNGQEVVAGRLKNSDLSKTEKLFAYYGHAGSGLFHKIRWVELDVRDVFAVEEALEGIQHVYHCAGYVSFSGADRKKLLAVNSEGTRNMVNACLYRQTPGLCHVSSIGTINNTEYRQALNETVFWKTSGRESDYALSKYSAEREVWRGIEEGLNAVIVNPGVVLSPVFRAQSSGRIFEQCYRGNRFYTGGKSAYVAATDVAHIMVRLVQEGRFSERFILTENNYPFREVFRMVHACLGTPAPSIRVGANILRLAGMLQRFVAMLSGRPPLLTKSLINAALNRQDFSNKKIIETLGYEFEPIGKTIGKICEYYLQEQRERQSSI